MLFLRGDSRSYSLWNCGFGYFFEKDPSALPVILATHTEGTKTNNFAEIKPQMEKRDETKL
jgi:hypothetical protein